MPDLANYHGLLLALIALAVVALPLLILWRLARLHPLISLAIGLMLLAVPVVGFVMLKRYYVPPATEVLVGLVNVVVYGSFAVVGLLCGFFGLVFAGDGAARLARREVVTGARRVGALAVAAVAGAGLAAAAAWRVHEAPPAAKRAKGELKREDVYGKLSDKIEDRYALAWKAREGAPPLSLAIPAADFMPEGPGAPRVQETQDGPMRVELRLPSNNFGRYGLTLHRGDWYVDEPALAWLDARLAPADPALPRALWIERGDGWSLRGLDCGPQTAARHPAIGTATSGVRCYSPETPLVRYLPAVFGLERARIHVAAERYGQHCTISFRFRGRVAQVTSAGECFGEQSVAMLRDGVALLDRLARGR